jgi:serine protease Do
VPAPKRRGSLKLSLKAMKFRSCWLIFTLVGLSLTSCGQQKPSEIAKTVENSIVLISYQNEGGHGTGFIVPGKTGVCTVLTARHVVEGHSLNLQTNDQKLHKTNSIQVSPNFDLAVVTFQSADKNCLYPSLNLGNSDVKVGDKIYISGFHSVGSEKLGREFIESLVSRLDVLENGYGISYQAQVFVGMSGGPVLDSSGKVVAVHGYKNSVPWGIPIKTYLANQSDFELAKVDYTKLEQLLAAGKWEEANWETAIKMLEVAGKKVGDVLQYREVENFSCPDLRAMDQLWVKYSNGRFGFSVQKRIYQILGGTWTKEYDPKIWVAYAEAIGWQKKEKGILPRELTWNTNLPKGNLPFWALEPSSAPIGLRPSMYTTLFFRAESCKL